MSITYPQSWRVTYLHYIFLKMDTTYDGTFGTTDKVLAFIQQFDAAFGDEGCTESSNLRHVAMHFHKTARQWWASMQANGTAPKTWKGLRITIIAIPFK